MIKFNMNDNVKVKLTPKGFKILRDEYNRTKALVESNGGEYKYPYAPPKVDADGYSEFQLWVLMTTFGNHLSSGFDLPFETTIYLEVRR